MPSDNNSSPLKGLRVLAVEQYGAGPFGAQHLADLGAEVIKIENRRTGGDYARGIGPYFAEGCDGDEGSLFFQSINRNKKSLAVDLTTDDGMAAFRRLVAVSDAVANNLRGDVPTRLGLTYEQLKGANGAIVCAHCSAYGREGPRKNWPGFDFLMQAEAGYFHLSGEPDTPPSRMGLSIVDFMSGTYLALGLLAGVLAARSTGIGRDVDVNLYDSALFNMSYMGVWALNSDYEPVRQQRSAHPYLVPCQLYRTKDGWLYVMCNKENFWPDLCAVLGMPELATDPGFATFASRAERRDELTGILDAALKGRTTRSWLREFRGRVPVAPVRTPREALEDPELDRQNKFDSVTLGSHEQLRMLGTPIRAGQAAASRPCPPLGADTHAILREAGFTEDEISQLEEKGDI